MTYRYDSSYLKFNGNHTKGERLSSVGEYINYVISQDEEKSHLRDQLAVSQSQNVYNSPAMK